MIIKSFTGESAASALKKVRTEMGGDAVVLKTRELPGNVQNRFEITACLDRPTVAQSSTLLTRGREETVTARKSPVVAVGAEPPANAAERATIEEMYDRMVGIERKLDRVFSANAGDFQVPHKNEAVQTICARMADADMPADYINSLLSSALEGCDDVAALPRKLAAELESSLEAMAATDLQFTPGDLVVFVGPPASGKTSALGKLAAHLVLHSRKKVNLVSLDTFKIGAYDEIHNYGDLLGISVTDAFHGGRVERPAPDAITLVDCPGLPADATKRQQVADKVRLLSPTCCFATFSALTRSSDIPAFLEWTKAFGPTHLIGTMLDMTSRFGSLVTASRQSSLRIAFVSDAPGGVGSIKTFDGSGLAGRIIAEEARHE